MTPRLEDEITSAINIYTETAKSPILNLERTTAHLSDLKSAIEAHWKMLFADMRTAGQTFDMIGTFREFIGMRLLEDHAGHKPSETDPVILLLAQCKGGLEERSRVTQRPIRKVETPEKVYNDRVIMVLDEMLDRAHVETKIQSALTRNGQAGSDIQPLIDNCDWAGLAAMLIKDEILTTKLFA